MRSGHLAERASAAGSGFPSKDGTDGRELEGEAGTAAGTLWPLQAEIP